jgi:hypothetical protein
MVVHDCMTLMRSWLYLERGFDLEIFMNFRRKQFIFVDNFGVFFFPHKTFLFHANLRSLRRISLRSSRVRGRRAAVRVVSGSSSSLRTPSKRRSRMPNCEFNDSL